MRSFLEKDIRLIKQKIHYLFEILRTNFVFDFDRHGITEPQWVKMQQFVQTNPSFSLEPLSVELISLIDVAKTLVEEDEKRAREKRRNAIFSNSYYSSSSSYGGGYFDDQF